MKFFLCLLFIIPQIAIGQVDPLKYEDPYKMDIDKHIFRLVGTFTLESSFVFTGCYEREIKKPFTFVVKAGPSIFIDDISINDYLEFAAMAAVELRYYFNLNRRIKREKITRNFSAGYLSLEPFVRSKSLIILDETGVEEKPAKNGVCINIGFQKQVKRSYINAFFGTRILGKIYSSRGDVSDVLQAGVALGLVIY